MTDRHPRILAIDDTPANLLTLGTALGPDFDLQIATSGPMGLAQAVESPPDLILLDVMMPEMNGYETCSRLQANPVTRDIPIIFVTAQNSPTDETRGLEAGAADFISKPLNPRVLRARVRTHLIIKQQADLLRSMAFIDGLTGVANRRQFDESLHSEWRDCRRTHSPLTLAMIDIDHFKQFNDAYGHQAGDASLKAVADVLKAVIGRSHDLIARYGGEEFVCLLPCTDSAGAIVKAEELRQSVQTLNICHEASGAVQVLTISIGVATIVPMGDLTPDRLIAAADMQLYEAKRGGRNRTCSMELI
jgi:diguanylate cyclase (GGDEF)-like protein